jgi:hypothetical protein
VNWYWPGSSILERRGRVEAEGGRLTTATSRVRRGSPHVGCMLVPWVLLPAPRRHRLFIWKNTSSSLLSTLLHPSPLLSPSLCLSLSPHIAFPERILNLYSFRKCNYNQPQRTLIKKKIKFSAYIRKFRVEPLQSHI